MNRMLFICLSFLLVSCTAYPPKGQWVKTNPKVYYEFSVLADKKCWFLARGKVDGIGFDCILVHERENVFRVFALDLDGTIDQSDFMYVHFINGNSIEIRHKEKVMELEKESK